jgi:hypothetical protein
MRQVPVARKRVGRIIAGSFADVIIAAAALKKRDGVVERKIADAVRCCRSVLLLQERFTRPLPASMPSAALVHPCTSRDGVIK